MDRRVLLGVSADHNSLNKPIVERLLSESIPNEVDVATN